MTASAEFHPLATPGRYFVARGAVFADHVIVPDVCACKACGSNRVTGSRAGGSERYVDSSGDFVSVAYCRDCSVRVGQLRIDEASMRRRRRGGEVFMLGPQEQETATP